MTVTPNTTVGAISARLAAAFNLGKAASWDPVGLQFGDPDAVVARVAVCHEVTPEVVGEAIGLGAQLLVSYHPLLFRPTTRLVSGHGAAGRAFQLITAGVALVVTHTAFDVAPGGTADSLADRLGLTSVTGFGPAWAGASAKVVTFVPEAATDDVAAAMAAAGAGTIGRYASCSYRTSGEGTFLPLPGSRPSSGIPEVLNREPEIRLEMLAPQSAVDHVVAALVTAHPYEEPAYDVVETRSNAGFIGRVGSLAARSTVPEFAEVVRVRLGGVVRVAGSGEVGTVAVIPGSGGAMLNDVTADVVVTGDVSHHQARDALSRGVAVIDPGHAATERPGVESLYAAVAEMVDHAIDMTGVDADPWKGC